MESNYEFKMQNDKRRIFIHSSVTDIKYWASKDLWTLDEFSSLILGVNPEVDGPNLKPSHPMDAFHEDGYSAYSEERAILTDLLLRKILSGTMKAINIKEIYFVNPIECIEYCQFNGLNFDEELKSVVKEIHTKSGDDLSQITSDDDKTRFDSESLLEIGIIAGSFCAASESEITKEILDSELKKHGYKNLSETLLMRVFKKLPDEMKAKGRPKGHIDFLIRACLFIGGTCHEKKNSFSEVQKLIQKSGNNINTRFTEKIYKELNGL